MGTGTLNLTKILDKIDLEKKPDCFLHDEFVLSKEVKNLLKMSPSETLVRISEKETKL